MLAATMRDIRGPKICQWFSAECRSPPLRVACSFWYHVSPSFFPPFSLSSSFEQRFLTCLLLLLFKLECLDYTDSINSSGPGHSMLFQACVMFVVAALIVLFLVVIFHF